MAMGDGEIRLTAKLESFDLARAVAFVVSELNDFVAPALSEAAEEVSFQAASLQHDYIDRTGALTRSIEAHPAVGQLYAGNLEAEVSADAGHAWFVEKGTRAHVIAARRAKSLRFFIGGQAVFRQSVQHPGTKARRFLAGALEDELGNVTQTVLEGACRAFSGAGFRVEI